MERHLDPATNAYCIVKDNTGLLDLPLAKCACGAFVFSCVCAELLHMDDSLHDCLYWPVKLTPEDARLLRTISTYDENGRHFTDIDSKYSAAFLGRMEASGFIKINRPVNGAEGYPYFEHWIVEVTPAGQ